MDTKVGFFKADDVTVTDVGDYYTGTDLETILQEIGAAAALNTAHRTSNGSDHGFIDQDVTIDSTPVFSEIHFDNTGNFKFKKNGNIIELWVQGVKVNEWG